MHDPVQGKGLDHILNDLLTERALGRVVTDAAGEAQWIWNGQPVLHSTDAPATTSDPLDVSYGAFLREMYPMTADRATSQRHKQQRKLLRQDFTRPGFAGEGLASAHEALLAQLELSTLTDALSATRTDAINASLAAAGLDTTDHVFLLPSFLYFVHALHARGTHFSLVFRTFGDDLARIAQEFNCFCEGRHPFFRLAESERMDGSSGSVDRRIHLTSSSSLPQATEVAVAASSPRFGTFFRSETVTALVMGTFTQPRDTTDDLTFYTSGSSSSSADTTLDTARLEVHTGIAAIHDVLTRQWRAQQATLAIRDFYPFWFAKREDARAGKLLPLNVQQQEPHDRVFALFFDDNILAHDAHIVDARSVHDDAPLDFENGTKDTHLVRVEPLEAIARRDFFLRKYDAALAQWQQTQTVG